MHIQEPPPGIKTRPRPSQQGQVALFVALIFQVLFIFFAMMINIGLLVHHKINLQNSVDLAAYYAASKQAETLNAIAHVNYQIHQSWKLLNFRYNNLGEFGQGNSATDPNRYPGQSAADTAPPPEGIRPSRPTFCIAYSPFSFMNGNSGADNDNYCKDSGNFGGTLFFKHPAKPPFGSTALAVLVDPTLAVYLAGVDNLFNALNSSLSKNCHMKTALNTYALELFIYGYKMDIASRKLLLVDLATNISSGDPNKLLDIDGGKIIDGVKNTLEKNLTYQNLDGLNASQVTLFNSLSAGSCGAIPADAGSSFEGAAPPGWLQEINVFPHFYDFIATDELTGATDTCTTSSTNLNSVDFGLVQQLGTPLLNLYIGSSDPNITPAINFMKAAQMMINEAPDSMTRSIYNYTIGYEKNPNCVAYMGVHAEASPNIPFSPFGTVKLEATAYAKPFGGQVGPWYSYPWTSPTNPNSGTMPSMNTQASMQDTQRWVLQGDPYLASSDSGTTGQTIGISRYAGDPMGTRSAVTSWVYGKVLGDNYAKTQSGGGNQTPMSLDWWEEIFDKDNILVHPGGPSNGDVLAYMVTPNPTYPFEKMREIEIAAVAPDNYDATYYSIEPDFYDNYFLRLTNNGKNNPPSYLSYLSQSQTPIRGDIGSRTDQASLQKFNVLNQVQVAQDILSKYMSNMPHMLVTPDQVLTSFKWWVVQLGSTDMFNNFGKCSVPKNAAQMPSTPTRATTGNCIVGGRVGYSVKLVDFDMVGPQSAVSLGVQNPTSGPDSTWINVGK